MSSGTRLPSGTRTPPVDLTKLSLLPVALAESKQQDLAKDPAKNCQPIGPFRLMARDDNKIELLRTPARMTMLHENVSLGSIREIYLTRQHSTKFEPGWNGESVGRWVADTLVVETIGFNDRTWLNDQGAPHSENLRVIERYRPILGGSYLAVTVTAEDPKVLAAPFTYTRYYKKTTAEIKEHICEY